jgi:hypothetical protein
MHDGVHTLLVSVHLSERFLNVWNPKMERRKYCFSLGEGMIGLEHENESEDLECYL